MKTEIKILRFLIENKEGFTIREIANKINADYKITHTAIKKLEEKKLINTRKIGKSIEITFANRFSSEIFEAEYQRSEKLSL